MKFFKQEQLQGRFGQIIKRIMNALTHLAKTA